ncbi:hypothetical protein JXA47_00310 [Candidatus Sumerlaeota bacterium]|nr:hypothetical protein [Candidatus Sumerlaeota bacterium]
MVPPCADDNPAPREPRLSRRQIWALCLWMALVFTVIGLLCLSAHSLESLITGDVPNIMMVMHSMLTDGDVDLLNNFEEGDWQEFFHFEFPPQYFPGTHFPLRSIGLPILLLPGFALGGPVGMMIWAIILNAAVCAALAGLAISLTGRLWVGLMFGLLLFGMTPFFFYQFFPYSDMYAGLLFLACFLIIAFRIAGREVSLGWNALAVSLACLIPWLHFKHLIPLPFIGLILLFANRHRPRRRWTAAIAMDAAIAALLLGFYLLYHHWRGVSLLNYRAEAKLFGNYHEGLIGTLFDRQFGVFYHSPVLLFGFLGLFRSLIRGPRRLAIVGIAIMLPIYGYSATHFYWWGGASPTGRLAMNWLYIFVFFTVVFFMAETARAWVVLFLILSAITLLNTAVALNSPESLFIFNEYPNHLVNPQPGSWGLWGVSKLFDFYGINDYFPSLIFIEGKNLRPLILTLTLIMALIVIDNWSTLRTRGHITRTKVIVFALLWIGACGALYAYLYARRQPSVSDHFREIYGVSPSEWERGLRAEPPLDS